MNDSIEQNSTKNSAQVPLLEVSHLSMHFAQTGRKSKEIRAVDDVSFTVNAGETLGLVGESGCGKTSVARCVVRTYEPTGGQLWYRDAHGNRVDLATVKKRQLATYRTQIRMIFQDPFSSLNPRMTIGEILAEPMRVNTKRSRSDIVDRSVELLRRVGLRPDYRSRYPHAFSGGERQRIVIARALALNPRLVVADEAVSALDVSVRAQILDLLAELQAEQGLTYLFISHDLAVIRNMCERVAVMRQGKIVESGLVDDVFNRPAHPYTQSLLDAVPIPDPRQRNLIQPALAASAPVGQTSARQDEQ